MKCRTCMKCKQYILIKDGSYKNQKAVEAFERDHHGHFLGTVDYNEVKDDYQSKTNEYMDKL
ncbi:MAG: hypothetical protein ACTSUE_22295 [Promethearchaeota archaeon]